MAFAREDIDFSVTVKTHGNSQRVFLNAFKNLNSKNDNFFLLRKKNFLICK